MSKRSLMSVQPLDHEILFPHGDDAPPDWQQLREFLKAEGRLSKEDALTVIRTAGILFRKEPNVIKVEYPVNIVGDVHGQYYDLLTIFDTTGSPTTTQYLFLGDYVDRGCFSVEIVLLMYAIKINFPDTFHMLRGNHECRLLTEHFNFRTECELKYDADIYEEFMKSFDALPLCAVVNERFFALHGGISPELVTLSQINQLDRFREPPLKGLLCDLLWADPYSEEGERGIHQSDGEGLVHSFETSASVSDIHESPSPKGLKGLLGSRKTGLQKVTHFVHNTLRGCSYNYGHDAAQQFLEQNKLLCIIRAHEAQLEGYKMQFRNPKTGFPCVITVFSAPNYCDVHRNKGAVLKLSKNSLHIQQFLWSRHPYYLPNFMDLFTWSVPFVSEKVLEMLHVLLGADAEFSAGSVELPPAVHEFIWGPDIPAPDAPDADETQIILNRLALRGPTIRSKVKTMGRVLQLYHELKRHNALVLKMRDCSPGSKVPLKMLVDNGTESASQEETFLSAQKVDMVNERHPALQGTPPA
ncbi:protein phosphatase 2B catalytic subunit, calcineurin family phosphatse superfamily protein [Babesia caballi]|uniref:Serine/threonine-protein phosphatase n=1 Tax=Babesia caballi TaxID=5871 RepID=A0AAV4M2C7_BABCB|nr:protein phosphatase 2B catalytic subunit, calcineurin family phosphatse superfamily protein [Babesia caballi]